MSRTRPDRAMVSARAGARPFVFLVLTCAVSAVFYAWSMSGAPLARVVPLLMWTPGVAAVVTQLVFHRTLAGLGWRLGAWRYLALAALLPIAYCLAVYVPVWLTGLGGFDAGRAARILPLLPQAFVTTFLLALGEEIGWRGLLAPALFETHGFAWAGIGTGIIWGLWHMPLVLAGGYNAGTPMWYGAACFMSSVTAMSVMLAWLRLRSGSLWTAALYHGVHNLAIQGFFDGSTRDTGLTRWITTEFGVGLMAVSVGLGFYFWRRRGELSRESGTSALQ